MDENLNILIIPRLIATRINDKLRGKEFQDVDYLIEEEVKKVTKKHGDITSKDYVCLYYFHSEPCVGKEINSAFNRSIERII